MKTTMQIILVQHEVEQALREYISSRLTIPEGTDFQIDLASTRGPEGVKAIIDLVPTNNPIPAVSRSATAVRKLKTATLASTAHPPTSTTTAATATISKPTSTQVEPETADLSGTESSEAGDTDDTSEDAAEEQAEEATEAEAQSAEPAQAAAPSADVVPETETEAAPATPPVRSLFANLRKPQNS